MDIYNYFLHFDGNSSNRDYDNRIYMDEVYTLKDIKNLFDQIEPVNMEDNLEIYQEMYMFLRDKEKYVALYQADYDDEYLEYIRDAEIVSIQTTLSMEQRGEKYGHYIEFSLQDLDQVYDPISFKVEVTGESFSKILRYIFYVQNVDLDILYDDFGTDFKEYIMYSPGYSMKSARF